MIGGFPVEDITHKPKRRQGQFVESKISEINQASRSLADTELALAMVDNMPKNFITLEKAVAFYESYPNCELFRYTAVCLRELLEYRKNIIIVNEKAKEKELQDNVEDEPEV